ncbi:YezD family protein [Paenibacillus camelliae]|uniref:YezD family protein n=1 Tax=Paenibacillus camelliae TaxID=512410 RepID=UPI0020413FB5|nr:YezD family protein [Paenibacillus camelliae]MCM3634443.1 YezD family protein [Paenibacillus camelliae]
MTQEMDNIWQQRITEQLAGMQYGQVIVTVHDGQIVQIDRMERTRYPLASAKESEGPLSASKKKSASPRLASS